ncbi:interleukin-1 receptor type 1 isoform X2 [Amia ocellicauda]
MGPALLFILLTISVHVDSQLQEDTKEEPCTDYGVDFERVYTMEGEAVVMNCSLLVALPFNSNTTYTISWFKNESQKEFTRAEARIQAVRELLWFLPAILEDTGHYVCVLGTPQSCYKQAVLLIVNETKNDDCNYIYKAGQQLAVSANGNIVCPAINIFVSEASSYEFLWYRDCELIKEGSKFLYRNDSLLITNVSVKDKANYTCRVNFILNGTTYYASRTLEPEIKMDWYLSPVIIAPHNNIVKADLGKKFNTTCKVFVEGVGRHAVDVIWASNVYFSKNPSDRIFQRKLEDRKVKGGTWIEVLLIISEVKEEDINQTFQCIVSSAKGYAWAEFILQSNGPNFIIYIGFAFATLTVVLIISVTTYKIFKIDIVLWYRSSFHHLYKKPESDGKSYDAYVIYPDIYEGQSETKAEVFALHTLPQVLERKCGYKLFICGRDGLPGEAVVDVVTENIKKSRRLILLYTSSTFFSAESHARFEQQSGMYSVLVEGTVPVILIELEEIKDYSDLPESIQHLKRKQGALKWKVGKSDKSFSPCSRFWKHVQYKMPLRQRPSYSEKSTALNCWTCTGTGDVLNHHIPLG